LAFEETTMSKRKQKQRLIREYVDKTGERELDMRKIAKWAVGIGLPLPRPPDPLDILAKEFTEAAREQVEHDKSTGKPYRRYHALKAMHGATQFHLFVDIEEATRSQMLVSLVNRREQMVSDGLMLSYDEDHWNSEHPKDEPIQLPMDLTFDIELRKHSSDDDEGSGGGAA
jgi:hypothetical protein